METATVVRVAPEPVRTIRAVGLALRSWTRRQAAAAVAFALGFAVLIGIPTVLIPNPVFGREIPVVLWNYPVWIVTSVLAGMLAATYVRPGPASETSSEEPAGPGRWGTAGAVLAWFAVGCPVCNKIALLALGYSGALTWFAPAQPYLAAAAMLLTAGALVFRLRGQVFCAVPAVGRA